MASSTTSDLARHWTLDPSITFLNHGSFGACPEPVLAEQRKWQQRLEREPVLFLHRELEGELDRVRAALGRFLGADPDDLVFVQNATAGVNTVLRSLRFAAGDELLTTDQEYNASRNALDFVAARDGARVTVAQLPFPFAPADASPAAAAELVVSRLLAAVTSRTKLLLIDAISSPTGVVFPFARIVREFTARGIDTLVDGAHAPGHVALDLDALGAAYFTGNCHKWMCTPKGSALLHVRRDRQARIRPLAISHGANSKRSDRSKFRLEFDWPGTFDPSPFLAIPTAIDFLGGLLPGGWDELRRRNQALVLEGRAQLLKALGGAAPCPETMVGCLAAVPLPDGSATPPPLDPLHAKLFQLHRIEVPVMPWPAPPKRLLRISAQLYNRPEQYAKLARIVADEVRA